METSFSAMYRNKRRRRLLPTCNVWLMELGLLDVAGPCRTAGTRLYDMKDPGAGLRNLKADEEFKVVLSDDSQDHTDKDVL